MTTAQRISVQNLQSSGFQIVLEAKDIVRMTRGSDRRIVMADGTQKRAHHGEFAK